jgi:phosphatidylglycerophosphate synthase
MAALLARHNVTPDQISVASVLFALAGSFALIRYPHPAGLVICAVAIQLRLLCNMLDGMVAVEHGKSTPLGHLFNEIPDRIADTLFIVALGYAAGEVELGWFAALTAVLTAYVRAFGGSLGLKQDFRGPMAKPQRMAVMTAACLVCAIELAAAGTRYSLAAAAYLIAIGSVITCFTRLRVIASQLRERSR